MSLCPLGISRVDPSDTFSFWPYNKTFIEQAFSVKMAGYWPRSFFALFSYLNTFCECLLQIFLEWVAISLAMNGLKMKK